MKTVGSKDLINRMFSEKLTLFEVLPLSYFNQGHLPNAVQTDIAGIEHTAKILGLNLDSPIIAYCASDTCSNSHKAAEVLESLGFKNVSVYTGGKKDWLGSGFEFVK